MANDAGLYETVLGVFINEYYLPKIESAYRSGDYETLTRLIHSIKGASGNIKLERPYEEACSAVKLLRSANFTDDELTLRYNSFTEEYKRVYDAIRFSFGR